MPGSGRAPMSFRCPECGARLRGGKPGAILACHACANPVVVPPPPAPQPEAPPPAAPVPGSAAQRSPWTTAGLVLALVAMAHVALFLLLTIDARGARSDIEARYTASELAAAPQPDAAPSPGTAAYRDWRRAYDLWLAAGEYKRHGKHVTLLRTGFVFSFLVQVCITGWVLAKIVGRHGRPAA